MERKGVRTASVGVFVISTLIIANVLLPASTRALETAVFTDDFADDMEVYPWTAQSGPGNIVEIVDDLGFYTPNCLHIKKVSTTSEPARATTPYIPLNYDAEYYIQLGFYLSYFVLQRGMLIVDDGRVYAWMITDTTLQFCGDMGGTTVNVPVTKGTFNHLKIMVHPQEGTYDVMDVSELGYIEGMIVEDMPFNGPPAYHLSVGTDKEVGTKHYGEVYYDDVRIIGTEGPAWSDHFDWELDGSIGDWTADVSGSGVVETSSVQCHSPPLSLHVKYSSILNKARATSPTINCDFTQPYSISMEYFSGPTKYIVVVDDGRIEIRERMGTIYAIDSDESELRICRLSSGTWNNIKVVVFPFLNDYMVVVDGQMYGSFPMKSSSGDSTISLGSEVNIGRRMNGEAYWDDIVVSGNGVPSPDSDGDGYSDLTELDWGTDPYGCDKWAVLVCGGTGDDKQELFENDADSVYRYLKMLGFEDSHIQYLSYAFSDNLWRDADGDGIVDVDSEAWISTIQSAIQSWLHSVSDRDDKIFIMFIDHGGQVGGGESGSDTGYFCVWGGESLYEGTVDQWLDYLNDNNDFSRLAFIVDCCYSGNWIHGDDTVAGPNRIVVTTSLPHQTTQTGIGTHIVSSMAIHLLSVEEAFIDVDEGAISDNCNPDTDPNGWLYF